MGMEFALRGGLPAAPACAVPDTADRPLRFAEHEGHTALFALFAHTEVLEWGVAPSAVSIRCSPGPLTERQNTDDNQMHRTSGSPHFWLCALVSSPVA
ncbi:MAG: hypothetical protein BWX48_00352 [Verrucomicrobia bacterium ADurb.Bin006]|jgi:hypothetical protein|nr:MAG: hypothetical protein BWX48_00352 [Verrucomicrobia bacterium ADurb.Bin006]